MSNTDSGSVAKPDDAGTDNSLDAAIDAAFDSVDLSGAEFQSKPGQGKTEPKVTKPVVEKDSEPASEAVPDEQGNAVESREGDQAPTDVNAPAHWDAQRREAFAKLDPEGQKLTLSIIKGYEADYTKKTTELAQDRQFAQEIKGLVTPQHQAQLEAAGVSVPQGIASLVALNDFYVKSPADYVRYVVQRSQLDPRRLFPEYFTGAEPPQQQQRAQDPNSQFYETIAPFLGEMRQDIDGFKQERQQGRLRNADQVIAKLRDEKDEGGNPKRPYFDRVEEAMTELLNSPKLQAIEDFSERLDAAYDQAVYQDKEIRGQIIESEAEKRARVNRNKADVAKARTARSPIRTNSSTPALKPQNQSLDDIIRENMEAFGA